MTGIEIATIPALTAGGTATAVTVGDALLAASTVMGTVGLVSQANAQQAAGKAAQRTAEYQAQLGNAEAAAQEQEAGQRRAAAQRQAITERQRGQQVSSRAQAVAAASGGDALDPTVLDIMGGIQNEADYRVGTALYQGEEAGRAAEYGAILKRAGAQGDIYAGNMARSASDAAANRSYLSAAGTLAGGAAKIGDRFDSRSKKGTVLDTSGSGWDRYNPDAFNDVYR